MTKIEWADVVWNPTTGCKEVSRGCKNCYAAAMTKRLAAMGQKKYQGLVHNGHFNGKVRCHEDVLEIPFKWQRGAARYRKKHGRSRRVFVDSMSDLYHLRVPFDFTDKIKAVEALCPDVTFIELTKRPERAAEYWARIEDDTAWGGPIGEQIFKLAKQHITQNDGEAFGLQCMFRRPLPNVHLYTSIEDQATFDLRWPHLAKCPAALLGLSIEPLLAPVHVPEAYLNPKGLCGEAAQYAWEDGARIGHVIVGGESGPNRRPCRIEWIRSIVEQCKAAGVPCFVKQDSGPKPGMRGRIPGDLWAVKELPNVKVPT